MSFMMRTAVEAIKGQVFKILLARLNDADSQQRAAAPVLLEKLESYAEPYLKALPKAINYVAAKAAFSAVFFVSFFIFFAEALRQIDQQGFLSPSAYLLGFLALLTVSVAGFFLVKPPVVEKTASAEYKSADTIYTPPFSASAKSTMEDSALPPDYSNVEQLRRSMS